MSVYFNRHRKHPMPMASKPPRLSRNEATSPTLPMEKASLVPNGYTYRYDFDVGYLVKSPCRECELMTTLPDCMADCRLLDQLQALLATTLSSCQRS